MKEVNVEIIVNDYKMNSKGIIEKGILIVKENDAEILFDLENLILTRINSDIKIVIDFKNNTMNYKIPESDKDFSNNLITLLLTNKDKEYNIIYQIEKEVFYLKIKYETI